MSSLTPTQQAYQTDLALVSSTQYGQNVVGRLLAGQPVYEGEYWSFAGSAPLGGMLNTPGSTKDIVASGAASPIPGRGRLVTLTSQGLQKLQGWYGAVQTQPLNSGVLAGVLSQVSPPPPAPDASDLSLGPNLGGSDAVTLPGDGAGMPGGSGAPVGQGVGGLLLAGGVVLLVLLAFRGK